MRRKIIKMNSKAKSIITLIVLVIIFALSPIISNGFNFNRRNSVDFTLDKDNLKISAISKKIHIINNSGWVAFKNAGNCTGEGTYSEPYVIEDLVINGEGSGSCILIENSNVYFRIENCTLFNSGYRYLDAGIRLESVSNGILLNNNAIDNNKNGMCLVSSDHIQFLGNNVSNNEIGIYLRYSDNNTISGNIANNNEDGIHFAWGNIDNMISGNNASYNGEDGIHLEGSDNANISGNTANYNGENGIHLERSDNTNISGNTASYNGENGIHLEGSDNANISGNIMNKCGLRLDGHRVDSHEIDTTNLVNGKPLYYYTHEVNLGAIDFTNAGQIIMVDCSGSVISNVNISYTSIGIQFFSCDNNEISGSTVDNNIGAGISLVYSGNNKILGNNANNNDEKGIYLNCCDENTVSGNTVDNNRYGIYLIYCDNNNILGNNATYNEYSGIFLVQGINNLISGNNANNNDEKGIYLNYCDENTVSGNTVDNNRYGIYLRKSDDNKISGNTIKNNNFGIYLECSCFNDITGNIFIGNSRDSYEDQNSCCMWGALERYFLIGILYFSLFAVFSVGVKKMIRKKIPR